MPSTGICCKSWRVAWRWWPRSRRTSGSTASRSAMPIANRMSSATATSGRSSWGSPPVRSNRSFACCCAQAAIIRPRCGPKSHSPKRRTRWPSSGDTARSDGSSLDSSVTSATGCSSSIPIPRSPRRRRRLRQMSP
ncbi:MAG: hypothetical protein AN485_22805 [Anabaena sp. MDT14b]|nr:MAG: hypothetical protein AN485_22805 [Anabaena sp. MDT14b]